MNVEGQIVNYLGKRYYLVGNDGINYWLAEVEKIKNYSNEGDLFEIVNIEDFESFEKAIDDIANIEIDIEEQEQTLEIEQ